MPDEFRQLPKILRSRVKCIVVAIASGKDNNAEFHDVEGGDNSIVSGNAGDLVAGGPPLAESHLHIRPVLQMRRVNEAYARRRGIHHDGRGVHAVTGEAHPPEKASFRYAACSKDQLAAGREFLRSVYAV